MALQDWVRLPSEWIEDHGLKQLRWNSVDRRGSDNIAALMTLMVIAHHVVPDTGIAKVTYDTFSLTTGLSRAKVSDGLGVLEAIEVIDRAPDGQSTYRLCNFNLAGGWCKLPAKRLYSGDRIVAFHEFRMRSLTELNALKLYFLFAARRGNDTNMANISFDAITEYSGIERQRIKAATSLLATHSLAYIERVPSRTNALGVSNAYRLAGLESYTHMGTKGREMGAGMLNHYAVEVEN